MKTQKSKDVFDFEDLLNVLALEMRDKDIHPCGIYIKNQGSQQFNNIILGLPLKINNLAKVHLLQEYSNPTQHYLEVEYSFPIEPNAVIHSFRAKFDQTLINGIIKQKNQAKKDYENGLKQGKQVAYGQLNVQSCDIFNLQIGNIPPKTNVTVEVEYIQQLEVVMSKFWKFTLVSSLLPRYIMQRDLQQWKQTIKPLKGLRNYKKPTYTWSFNLSIETEHPITFKQSSSHKLIQTKSMCKNKVQLEFDKKQKIEKDFVFVYCTDSILNYTLGSNDSNNSAVISFIPKLSEIKSIDAYKMMLKDKSMNVNISKVKGQYIFLLDRSGSMSGHLITNAIEALKIFIKSLPVDCYVNIISFGSHSQSMFNQSQKYSYKLIQNIQKQLSVFQANFGGTQIYQPLKNILFQKPLKNYPKHVFILTDGQVSNTKSIIELVQSSVQYSRVHTIGIGDGVSQALIKGCASKGKGKYVFIKNVSDISQCMIDLLESSLSQFITDIKLQFDQKIVECIVPNPEHIPYSLQNVPLTFYIIFNNKFNKTAKFKLNYQYDGIQFTNTIIVQNNKTLSFPFVDKMVYHKKIHALYEAIQKKSDEGIFIIHSNDIKKNVIQQSIKHQVLCPLTSFVCIGDKLSDQKYVKFMNSRIQIQQIQQSSMIQYSGIKKPHRFRPGTVALRQIRKLQQGFYDEKFDPLYQPDFSELDEQDRNSNEQNQNQSNQSLKILNNNTSEIQQQSLDNQSSGEIQSTIKNKTNINSSKILQVINKQNFDGSWKVTATFLKFLFSKKQVQEFKKISQKIDQNFVLTVLILNWISLNYNKPQYSLIIKKASSWIQNKQRSLKLKKNYKKQIQKLIIK